MTTTKNEKKRGRGRPRKDEESVQLGIAVSASTYRDIETFAALLGKTKRDVIEVAISTYKEALKSALEKQQ